MLDLSLKLENIQVASVISGALIIVATITSLYSPEGEIQTRVVSIGIPLGLILLFVIPFIIFIWKYTNRAPKSSGKVVYGLAEWVKRETLRYIPKISSEGTCIQGFPLIGYKAIVKFEIHNTTPITLDDLDAKVEIIDLKSSKHKVEFRDLADILPKKKDSYEIPIKLGRLLGKYKIILKIRRKYVQIGSIHFSFSD